jgi:ATP-binding cassette subfamily D (ALD) protein 3
LVDTAEEQKLEGEFRFVHSRVLTHAEEIAFYQGGKTELQAVNRAYHKVQDQGEEVMQLRFFHGIFDSVFVKYLATVFPFHFSRPFDQNNR